MAQSVGSLVAVLGLDATEYTRGLTKAELQAQRFAQNTRTAILEVGKVLGGLAIAQQVVENAKAIVSEAAALDNLSTSLGSSVESLSRLNNQARIAGADFSTLQNAALRLAAGMAGADDESSKVKDALRVLGITSKDPVEALEQVAVKLNTYADGVNKVAIAQALFGKQGLTFLATLRDIADLQDVGATVTAKQAAEANNLEKSFRRLGAEATAFRNAILSDVVPALQVMIDDFVEGTRAAGGFLRAIVAFGTLSPFDTLGEQLKGAQQALNDLNSRRTGQGDFITDLNGEVVDASASFKILNAQVDFLKGKIKRQGLALISPDNADARDLIAGRKPGAPNLPNVNQQKQVTSEAQRYLEALEKQLERTQELTTTEQFLRDIQLDRIKGLTPALKDQIFAVTQAIDEFKALEKQIEESKKAWEDETKAILDNVKAQQQNELRALDAAERAKESADALRDEIAIILGGEAAREALANDYADAAIAKAEQNRALREGLGASQEELRLIDAQIDQLKEYRELLNGKTFAQQLKADAEALQGVKNLFSDALVDPLTDFITGTKSAKDALKAFTDDLVRQISRIASQNIANALFGGKNTGGPDFFGLLSKLLGGISFGSFGGGIGDIGAGGSGGLGYAAAGTTWARGGSYMVGEQGPEVVNLPSGARVTPRNYSSNGETSTFSGITINIPPGAPTSTIRQQAKQGLRAAVRARTRG